MITDSQQEKVSLLRKFKRAYQRLLLVIIGRLFPIKVKQNPNTLPKNILIFLQEKLGDAILTTPLIKNLKKHFPEIQLHLVIFNNASNIFSEDPNIYEVHNFKNDKLGTARRLKKYDFDILFNTKDHPSFTYIALSRYLSATYKVGIDHRFHRNHYHCLISLDFMTHTIDKNCSLLTILNIQSTADDLKPYIPPKKLSSKIDEFAGKMPVKKFIGINLSAGSKEKEWKIDEWKLLINKIDEKFIVFAVDNQLENKKILETECSRVISSPDTTSINDAAAITKNLKLLITPSTGLLHVASCFDIGVVGLYRKDPSDHKRFAPFGIPFKKVIAENHIVSNVPVSQVVSATKELLMEMK